MNKRNTIAAALALLCALAMIWMLGGLNPRAEALELTPNCGLEEHTHTDACYDLEGFRICGLEEHVHTDACYQAQPQRPEELDEVSLSDVALMAEATTAPAFDMTGRSEVTLRAILRATAPGIGLDDIEDVGEVLDGDVPARLAIRQEDGEWIVSAPAAFKEAELAIVTSDDITVIRLFMATPNRPSEIRADLDLSDDSALYAGSSANTEEAALEFISIPKK